MHQEFSSEINKASSEKGTNALKLSISNLALVREPNCSVCQAELWQNETVGETPRIPVQLYAYVCMYACEMRPFSEGKELHPNKRCNATGRLFYLCAFLSITKYF